MSYLNAINQSFSFRVLETFDVRNKVSIYNILTVDKLILKNELLSTHF